MFLCVKFFSSTPESEGYLPGAPSRSPRLLPKTKGRDRDPDSLDTRSGGVSSPEAQ